MGSPSGSHGAMAECQVRRTSTFQEAAYCSLGPQGCLGSQEDGTSEAPENSQPDELGWPGGLCNLCLSSTPSLLGSPSSCLLFCCLRGTSSVHLFSTSSWKLSLSAYSTCLCFPVPLISKAPCNMGLCSQSQSPGRNVQRSWASIPSWLLSFLPPVGWG